MKRKVAIIGAGSMGTALSVLLAKNGHKVKLWSKFIEEVEMINRTREHLTKLPGIKVPDGVECTTEPEEALRDAEAMVIALPSQAIRQNLREIAGCINEETIIICCSKGIELASRLLLSQVIEQEVPGAVVAALSGPSHAEEIARDIPTAVVAASNIKDGAEFVQDLFMSPDFRVYTNTDITGVELGGAIKNVIALCAGISDGLGFGDNTKAAIMTRGIAEISRLGTSMGALPQTFAGLTGIGDLIVTCTSMHSRNRRAGILIGRGKSVEEAIDEVGMVVEGVSTTKPSYELSKDMGVSMPITTQAYKVLFEGKDPMRAVRDLMTRDKKDEI